METLPSILFQVEDLDLANFLTVNEYTGFGDFEAVATPAGQRAIKIEDGEVVFNIGSRTAINAGNSKSLELQNTNVDFQTSGPAKVILIILGSATTLTDFEIIEDSSADSGAGTQKEDFPSVSIGAAKYITSKTLSFAASKFITIKVNTGNIGAVFGYVIE